MNTKRTLLVGITTIIFIGILLFNPAEGVFAASKPPKTSVESCTSSSYNYYSSPQRAGPNSYKTPIISHNGPVYERELNSGDFTARQDYTFPQTHYHYWGTTYSAPSDTETTSYYCNKSDDRNESGPSPTVDGTGSISGTINVSMTSDTKMSDGRQSFYAIATFSTGASVSMSAQSYYVVSANFTNSDSDLNRIEIFDPTPTITCRKTYGDGSVKSCNFGRGIDTGLTQQNIQAKGISDVSSLTPHSSALSSLLNSNRITQSEKTRILTKCSVSSSLCQNNLSGLRPTSQYTRSSGDYLSLWTPSDNQVIEYNIYGYYDSITKKGSMISDANWKLATVDVEDETTGKKVYAYDKKDLTDVTCTIYFYGPNPKKDCKSDMFYSWNCEVITDNDSRNPGLKNCQRSGNNVASNAADVFKEGQNEFEAWERTGSPKNGSPYRTSFYEYAFDNGTTRVIDRDFRTNIYVVDVNITNPAPVVKVTETHEKGLPTDVTYWRQAGDYDNNGRVEGRVSSLGGSLGYGGPYVQPNTVSWQGYKENFDTLVRPTCTKTYADGTKRDCTNRIHITWDTSNKPVLEKNNGQKNFNYPYGLPQRVAAYEYVENGYAARADVTFKYVTNVEIKITKSGGVEYPGNMALTYADQPYPAEYHCTKSYGAEKVSCLNKMFIAKDTGQNDVLGDEKIRTITYNYVNNKPKWGMGPGCGNNLPCTVKPFEFPKGERRVYPVRVVIANNDSYLLSPTGYTANLNHLKKFQTFETKGKSGARQNYKAYVFWQDGKVEEVTNKAYVWTSRTNGERVDFIGENWAKGYTDRKGITHKPNSLNQLYIPDPVSRTYDVFAKYPDNPAQSQDGANNTYVNGPFHNNQKKYWTLVSDLYSAKEDKKSFDVIGIKNIRFIDDTTIVHALDLNASGTLLTSPFGRIYSSANSKAPNGYAFVNKTYQTGQWYDFKLEIEWDDGTKEEVSNNTKYPELSYSYIANGGSEFSLETYNGKIEATNTVTSHGFSLPWVYSYNLLGTSPQSQDGVLYNQNGYWGWLERAGTVILSEDKYLNQLDYEDNTVNYPANGQEFDDDLKSMWDKDGNGLFTGSWMTIIQSYKATFSSILTKEVKKPTTKETGWHDDGKGYTVERSYNNGVPNTAMQFRLPFDGWNTIRFDYFSEYNIPHPKAQVNAKLKNKTNGMVDIWSHSALKNGLTITGVNYTAPTKYVDWGTTHPYEAHLIFTDSKGVSYQSPTKNLGAGNNPWGHTKPLNVTDNKYIVWEISEGKVAKGTDAELVTFDGYKGLGDYRTLKVILGDKYLPVGADLDYWNNQLFLDYNRQTETILVGTPITDPNGGGSIPDGCSDILVSNGCPIPVNKPDQSNYRIPSNTDVATDVTRSNTEKLRFWVTGVSKGAGN